MFDTSANALQSPVSIRGYSKPVITGNNCNEVKSAKYFRSENVDTIQYIR